MAVVRWLRAAGDLVLPRACVACAFAGTWWCDRCAPTLRGPPFRCDAGWIADRVDAPLLCHAVAAYHGPAGTALVAMKERGVGALVPALADALARAVRASIADLDGASARFALVPAPSRPAAVRRRGVDVLGVLARRAARSLRAGGLDVVVVPGLRHVRPVADQADLDARSRASNLAGALALRPGAERLLLGRTVVVVDDVLTTGATLTEAARAITVAVPGVALVAATVAVARAVARGAEDVRAGDPRARLGPHG